MVFQAALNAFNPVLTIWDQTCDTAKAHGWNDKTQCANARSNCSSSSSWIPKRVIDAYPHELSGGMRQRVLLALSLLLDPQVLILDEPTTALDILTQRTIIELLRELKENQHFTMIFISHDLAIAAELADRIATMYAGRIVELGSADDIFYRPRHPYTLGLIRAVPTVTGGFEQLFSIPGSPPDLIDLPTGCKFHPRCPLATDRCNQEEPDLDHRWPRSRGGLLALGRGPRRVAAAIRSTAAHSMYWTASIVERRWPDGADIELRNVPSSSAAAKRRWSPSMPSRWSSTRARPSAWSARAAAARARRAMVAGLLDPTAGEMLFEGKDISKTRRPSSGAIASRCRSSTRIRTRRSIRCRRSRQIITAPLLRHKKVKPERRG